MQLFFLVLINIIMATIFYLILRLKLEKYASDYREKRLKREMDEIICEFNETAERNISLLESRIEVLKRVLETAGTINTIDIQIDDNNKSGKIEKKENIQHRVEQTEASYVQNHGLILKCYSHVRESLERAYKKITNYKPSISDNKNNNELYNNDNLRDDLIPDFAKKINSQEIIDITISDEDYINDNKQINTEKLSGEELKKMFALSEDKYVLISELLDQGFTAELLSKSSGIPIGEIKLVLDLNTNL